MRSNDDYTYLEWKENVSDAFLLHENDSWPAEGCTNYLIDEEYENHIGFEFVGATSFLFLLAVAVREIELDILEDRIRQAVSLDVVFYDRGKYVEDLSSEEKKLVDKDISFIRSSGKMFSKKQLKEMLEKGQLTGVILK